MKLHIGASRTQLALPKLQALRTAEWIHLGEPETIEQSVAAELADKVAAKFSGQYLSFYYKKGDRLPFANNSFTFAFSEMFNNAIEHSSSKIIGVEVALRGKKLSFMIEDSGVGAFRNIMKKRNLHSEIEAIQDLLKGKTTTMPKSHSGEGIFFTSKSADLFLLDSFGYQLSVSAKDTNVRNVPIVKRGTRVIFEIAVDSQRHLTDVFRKYTNLTKDSDYGFDKTEIRVKLYTMGGIHISRSQARRILSGLDKFQIILLDFDQVPVVGQAFADEIYRVFQNSHPNITIQEENMSEGVAFMVNRAKHEAKIKSRES